MRVNKQNKYEIERRSGWSVFFLILGCGGILTCIISIFLLIASNNDSPIQYLNFFIIGILAAIQCFFLSFLVDVFTDIRWFIKKISEK